jgi:hypothetical protein
VIGGTWHSAMGRHPEASHRADTSWFVNSSRYQQIVGYVSRAGSRAEHWLAIDDDAEGWAHGQHHHLVETNGKTGLSSLSAQEDCRMKLSLLKESSNVGRQ